MQLFLLVLVPVILALFSYLLNNRKLHLVFITFQSGLFIMSVHQFIQVYKYGTIINALGGYDRWLSINLVADSISILFVTLTCFLFLAMLVFNYHKDYMNRLFLFLFILLEGLINGIFLSSDIFDIYTLIEVSTVTVSILIMFKRDSQSIYDGMIYLITNLVAMAFFLLGIGYMYRIFGSLDFIVIKSQMPNITNQEVLILPYTLLVTAIGLKSALMPLFSWLPRAHGTPSAPSIVSAILSGLYVKGGVYLFIRLQDMFGSNLDTGYAFLVMGLLTSIIGFIFALSQTDIKLILAYHTVSQIGLIIMGLSIGSEYSYYGSIYHIMNHSVFKSTLFLTAGMVIEVYGTRDIRKIKGVYQRMPYVAVVMTVAILGITGAPLFNGSISKYLIQKGTNNVPWLEYAMLIVNLGTIVSFTKYAQMLFGHHSERYKVRWNQKIAIGTLALITFLGGLFGQTFVNGLFHLNLTISPSAMLQKLLIYLMSLLIGFLFYKYIYPSIKFFKTMKEIELSFNEIVFSIFFFFSGFLGYMMILY